MRVFNLGTARPQWYDRGPIAIGQLYAVNGVAPHAQTTRWTYTVPASRKALIEVSQVSIARDGAAGAASTSYATITTTGVTNAQPIFSFTQQVSNTLGTFAQSNVGTNALLLAGQSLTSTTQDNSTGGTNGYTVSAKITEYDS